MGYNVEQRKQGVDGDQGKFLTFEDMEVYKAAREFRKAMYNVAGCLPDFEKFGLTSQIRRAAVSLTNNIAEGHGRYHFADQVRFFLTSRGSLQELIDDLNVCVDEKYLAAEKVQALKSESWRVMALINGFLRHLRDRKKQESSVIQESNPIANEDEMDAFLEEALRLTPLL